MNDFNKNNFFSFIEEETGKRKFFLKINGQMIEVDKDVYYVYYNSYRKELRDSRRDEQNGLLSYDVSLDEGFTLLDTLSNYENPIDVITYQNQLVMIEQAIQILNKEDRNLFIDLFLYEKTEREIAEQYHVSRQMINKRKQKLIKKIKEFLKSGC